MYLVLRIADRAANIGERRNGPLANAPGWTTLAVLTVVGAGAVGGVLR